MSYYEDAIKQLNLILDTKINRNINEKFNDKIEKVFLKIYALNYISNRIEICEKFQCNYFKISFSCLMESFSLVLNNYPRGASLVLRSSLENLIKYIISTYNSDEEAYNIDDRSYTSNKVTLQKIIDNNYNNDLNKKCTTINSQMERDYKRLSALSHSLVPESATNTFKYFSDMNIINNDIIIEVLDKLNDVLKYIFSFCMIVCQNSIKKWETTNLIKIVRLVFNENTTNNFIKILKSS